MIRKIFTFVGAILLMLLLAIIALPLLFPIDDYRDEILKIAQEKTGRDISVMGDISLTILPNIAVEINDVTIGNPKNFTTPHFAKISTLHLRMALLPLFEKRFEVNELLIDNGDIHLEELSSGKQNWKFVETKINKLSSSNEPSSTDKSNFIMDVDSIIIENTKLTYIKDRTKVSANSLNLNYANNEANLNTKVNFAGTDYKVVFTTSNTDSLFAAADTPISLDVSSPLINSKFKGKLQGVDVNSGDFNAKLSGAISAKITGTASVDSNNFYADLKNAKFNDIKITSAMGITASGDLAVNYSSRKPHIKADLSIPEIDINKFIQNKNKKASISLIKNAHASEKWSKDRIDLSALNFVNADADIAIGKLITKSHILTNFISKISLKKGKLNINKFNSGLLDGSVSGNATISSNGNWSKTLRIKQVPFEKIAADYMDNISITGSTNGSISLRSSGYSINDWMSRLSGGGNISISNGVIKGFYLPDIFRHVIGLGNKVVKYDKNEKTKLESIKTAFSIDKGVMRLRETNMSSDRFKAGANGTISIASKSLNLRLTPELLPKVEVEEGSPPVTGLMVPVIVKGEFNNITMKPDYNHIIGDLIKNPKDIESKLKNFKTEGKSIEDSFEPSKKIIKDNWKNLKNNKDPEALKNIFNELENNGLKLF